MMIHAPKSVGYDFDAKQSEYRAPLWKWVNDHSWSIPIRNRRVCYLDTRQALETEYLLSLGYSPRNLHPCNLEPIEVALLTKQLDQLGVPRVNTHGIDIARVVKALEFDVVSFDGCGHLGSPATLRTLRSISRSARPRMIISATILGGRESGETASELRVEKDGGNSHGKRWAWLSEAIELDREHGVSFRRWRRLCDPAFGSYVSVSGQAMLWIVEKLTYSPSRSLMYRVDGATAFRRGAPKVNGRDLATYEAERQHNALPPLARKI